MKLDEIVSWYQKKIGTYDKQQWEKTVEQKILDGFSSVTLKTAKLKTDLIDVDLVRGSTFPKAKPKQSLLTVIRFAILRYIFLPIYANWWVKQTSPNVFGLLLFLYITQMINWGLYTYNIHRLDNANYPNGTIVLQKTDMPSPTVDAQPVEHIVSISELLIPMGLSLLLSLIHSQIVATNIVSGSKTKRRRFSNDSHGSKNRLNGSVVGDSRVRRRRKLIKVRSQDATTETATQNQRQRQSNVMKKSQSSADHLSESQSKKFPPEAHNAAEADSQSYNICHQSTNRIPNTDCQKSISSNLRLDLDIGRVKLQTNTQATSAHENTIGSNKKRNVNWQSPIDNFTIMVAQTSDKQQQTSPNIGQSPTASSTSTTSTTSCSVNSSPNNTTTTGGESGKCSPSTSTNSYSQASPVKMVRIDDSVQEFYEDLISRTDEPPTVRVPPRHRTVPNARRNVGEDDGFESLNGKSSSGEETTNLPGAVICVPNQLRLRLNVGESQTIFKCDEADESKLSNGYHRKTLLSSDYEKLRAPSTSEGTFYQKGKLCAKADGSSEETEEEGDVDDAENVSSPNSLGNNSNYTECTTSATEWLGVTTNSDECSYSSELENSDGYKNHYNVASDEDGCDLDFTPTTILNPHGTSDRISCTIWDQREIKKAQMSVLEISSCIIERVESMPETNDYIYFGIGFSILLSFIPSFCRLCEVTIDADSTNEINYFDIPMLLWEKSSFSIFTVFRFAFGHSQWERAVLVIGFFQRLCLTVILFIIFSVAERTFKQRFLYAKLFSHLTSSRRAKKSNLPHFRLNKVRNIKTWLSVRSYLKKRGPQRSVDVIVSAAFIVTLLLLAFLSVEWLKDSVHLHSHLNLEALLWSTTIGIFLLRFMTLGNKIHHKYRSVSVLITEQINLYLQIEQKPKKKDELMVSNSVLKLASDLLKELESPFKISGLSANPYLFTTIKVVILSALSGVLSEMLGFKLKLHKIKIK